MKRSLCRLVALCVSGLLAACGGGGSGNNCGGGCSQLATHFSVTTPQDATVGASFSFTVTAFDSSNAVAKSYAGPIHFMCSDGQAVLPANSTLANGTGAFSATFSTSGNQTITATDIVTPTITGVSNAIQVSIAPPTGSFTPTAGSLGFPRAGHTTTFKSAILFNSSDASFSEIGDMSSSRVSHTATPLTGGEVLVVGGAVSNTKCDRGFGTSTLQSVASAELFNPAGTFTPTGTMETARAAHTATLLGNGKVLPVGGVDANDNALASAELFQ